MMKEKDIDLEWLFTLAKVDNKEGLMYFKPLIEVIDGTEVSNLDPKCFVIDGAKYIYDEEMDEKIVVNCINNIITFTRIDGIQLNIDTTQIMGFPFNLEQFKNNPIEAKPELPGDFVEITE